MSLPPTSLPIDDALVARLKAGEPEAFNALVRLCHRSVYGLALRMLGHHDDAQEVAQEAFLAAYQGLGGFGGRANVRTWLLSITYRKAVDRLKKRSTERALVSAGLDEEELGRMVHNVEHLTDWGSNPEQHYTHTEIAERLRAALEKLSPDNRAVFELRDLQGFSSKEAAAVLDINEGAVRVRLHRVRQFLMQELQTLFVGADSTP